MKRFGTSLFIAMIVLAGCGQQDSAVEKATRDGAPPPPAPMMEVADLQSGTAYDNASVSATQDLPQRAGLYLAYSYNRTISVPAEALKDMVDAHSGLCMEAGPKQCLVTSSNVNGLGTEYANGYLTLKASPEWTETFLTTLTQRIAAQDASVTDSSTSAVDLTSQIIDTDAQLKAQKTLRDRLQNLLETREGELDELLNVERELARVQGQIDSYESNLANLRQRVSMSDIYLNYSARVSPVSQSVWRPLTNALDGFFGNIASALSGIVNLFAFLLPWIPVVFGLVWLTLFGLRKMRRTSAGKAPQTKTDEI